MGVKNFARVTVVMLLRIALLVSSICPTNFEYRKGLLKSFKSLSLKLDIVVLTALASCVAVDVVALESN